MSSGTCSGTWRGESSSPRAIRKPARVSAVGVGACEPRVAVVLNGLLQPEATVVGDRTFEVGHREGHLVQTHRPKATRSSVGGKPWRADGVLLAPGKKHWLAVRNRV